MNFDGTTHSDGVGLGRATRPSFFPKAARGPRRSAGRALSFVALPVALLALGACLWLIRPGSPFSSMKPPPAPDYALAKNWAALPERKDLADRVPVKSMSDEQDKAAVDVFYIHPTTYFGRSWNADLSNKRINERTDKLPLKLQASVYNCCGRIFAPRYRQATLYSFLDTSGSGVRALDLAYGDVHRAFAYYLKHYNKGRGVIIASHSQGSKHATQLLADFFDAPQPKARLVAAYVIGMAVRMDLYKNLKACAAPDQIGCVISYRTVTAKAKPRRLPLDPGGQALCVNPISWSTGPKQTAMAVHKGGVPRSFDRLDPHLITARCRRDGFLEVSLPKKDGYPHRSGDYHTMDYGLFYQDLRENVALRVRTFLAGGK